MAENREERAEPAESGRVATEEEGRVAADPGREDAAPTCGRTPRAGRGVAGAEL